MPIFAALSRHAAPLPEDLQSVAAGFYERLAAVLDAEQAAVLEHEAIAASALKVCVCSQFVADSWLREPGLIAELAAAGDLFAPTRRDQYAAALRTSVAEIDGEPALAKVLRRFRRREMVRIAWRDLAGWADLDETLADLTALAEACIAAALDYLYARACDRWGTPTLADGRPFNIVVLGMGKLGAWELNYSSDIDLIFAFAEDGLLTGKKEISYGEFFTRLCRSLVKMLDEITVDGFVFRTDVRLRPFGDSGPLIMDFDGMEKYYLTQAREWERYAMIKARQVAGDFETGRQLAALIKPFVYRRYLDYGAFEELRSLKFQIAQELKRRDRLDNVKLGPGGIREVEFIGQAFQLIRGGQEPVLQQREIQVILAALADLKLMSGDDVAALKFAYRFLRRTENHIQEYQDKQTHDLPTQPVVRQILAYSLDFEDWEAFKRELDAVRERVQDTFEQVFSLSEQDTKQRSARLIWTCAADDDLALEALADYGFSEPRNVLQAIVDFKHSHAVKRMTAKGATILERLVPQTIERVAETEHPETTLPRVLKLFEAVTGRAVYLSLLAENPQALAQLIKLTAASPWIADYLALYPILFDELLDTGALYAPLQKQALREDLGLALSRVEAQDSEQLMIALRLFKHQHVLRVAAADIMGFIPVMVVSDYLTWIAEAILEQVLARAWAMLGAKHGYPPATGPEPKHFAILGFGKFGGIELGYGSDLDLVFLYDAADGDALTDGDKPIGTAQFYIRLGQKIRHILDTRMLSGVLYEVDLRLRPNGDSGLLVTHIGHYEAYLRDQAWTWEHQALVRARFVAGDTELQTMYEAIRERILALPRDYRELQTQVREMRQKMRDNLAAKDPAVFDLKQSAGGIADIEFIVQFCILAHAARHSDLAKYTDNVRLLDGLQAHGLMPAAETALLKQAYCAYRDYGHHQVLQDLSATAAAGDFTALRAEVERLWQQYMC
ncbi:bifunctional [glutamate--ammonia ligase]-adenylyl-L-tyrosine phosphorylase/[glutamate--ammonia-ligase] adenylyltransferase [Methylococcaceae bacterium WWC4]|nr:bifunctional [glutamate--ammonia ligase]-adenylyl-L-tyrosine phosphorylase/[glutamate--ammonia-ligase] adenylyltransferase [Methylococcaceae bacterium WWC4]